MVPGMTWGPGWIVISSTERGSVRREKGLQGWRGLVPDTQGSRKAGGFRVSAQESNWVRDVHAATAWCARVSTSGPSELWLTAFYINDE